MKILPIGKVPWDLLLDIVSKQGYTKNKGIIQKAEQGVDVAVLDLAEVFEQVNNFYNTKSIPYLVYKADPITFPTPNPARYLINVNKNDLVTSGAIPYGITITILLPPSSTKSTLTEFQSNLSEVCEKNHITILGGHTEITEAAKNIVLSASMIGFVPPEYYIPRNPRSGDAIICSGWVGAEGTGILLKEGKKSILKRLTPQEYKKGVEIGTMLDISERIIKCNKQWHAALHLVHDATEGGIVAAIYECLSPKNLGCKIDGSKIPVAPITKKLCNLLKINPLFLIASGAVLLICNPEKALEITEFLRKDNIPAEIIGEVTDKGMSLQIDNNSIKPPEADHIIKGLKRIQNLF